jgi:prepilin-type N-terminal cleavage/methylation domain-containing protein
MRHPIIRSDSAFTLLELLVVMGIMVLMMTIGALSWVGMRRGAELRGAAATVRTTLMLARQQAVMKRQTMEVALRDDGTTSFMDIRVKGGSSIGSHSTASLTPGIKFVGLPTIIFSPGGGGGGGGTTLITVQERGGVGSEVQSMTLTNWSLTGITE